MRLLLLLALLAMPSMGTALQVQVLEVSRDRSVYHIVVEALIDAPPARVRALLLDVDALPRINPSIKRATAVALADGFRVSCELEECLLGFCRSLLQVQTVRAVGNEINAETLPVEGSSFKSGIARWQLSAAGQDTRLLLTADTEPDVWLPPFIGPRAVMGHLREKTLSSLQVLEQLARE